MKTRTLLGTDLELSVVGMGCWAIGGRWWGDDVTDENSVKAVHAALDCGINWFDTAPLCLFFRFANHRCFSSFYSFTNEYLGYAVNCVGCGCLRESCVRSRC